jgi:hypothetical protein
MNGALAFAARRFFFGTLVYALRIFALSITDKRGIHT